MKYIKEYYSMFRIFDHFFTQLIIFFFVPVRGQINSIRIFQNK